LVDQLTSQVITAKKTQRRQKTASHTNLARQASRFPEWKSMFTGGYRVASPTNHSANLSLIQMPPWRDIEKKHQKPLILEPFQAGNG